MNTQKDTTYSSPYTFVPKTPLERWLNQTAICIMGGGVYGTILGFKHAKEIYQQAQKNKHTQVSTISLSRLRFYTSMQHATRYTINLTLLSTLYTVSDYSVRNYLRTEKGKNDYFNKIASGGFCGLIVGILNSMNFISSAGGQELLKIFVRNTSLTTLFGIGFGFLMGALLLPIEEKEEEHKELHEKRKELEEVRARYQQKMFQNSLQNFVKDELMVIEELQKMQEKTKDLSEKYKNFEDNLRKAERGEA